MLEYLHCIASCNSLVIIIITPVCSYNYYMLYPTENGKTGDRKVKCLGEVIGIKILYGYWTLVALKQCSLINGYSVRTCNLSSVAFCSLIKYE